MIVGITGTLGAGKGTVVDYLKTKGFTHYSARDVWNEEIARRGLPPGRDSMVLVSNELRAQHGSDYFVVRALQKAAQAGGDAAVESIRSIGEAQRIKSSGGLLWAVDADIHTRFERVSRRNSETDHITFEKFAQDEKREWENADPSKQNLKAVIAMADATLRNDGAPEELFAQVERALGSAKKP